MDKSSRKRGGKGPSRKKRLQLDFGTSQPVMATSQETLLSPQRSSSPDKAVNDVSSSSALTTPTGETSTSTTRPKSASPEPNCAICLGKLENKSFTDSCFHMFCFVCLEEWSKVKAECPLCKQTFKSIIHNVRSYNDYDQYQVQRPPEMRFGDMMDGQRFRYRTTVTDHRYAFAHFFERERQSRMLQRPSRYTPIPNWRRLRQPANSEFRRSVYDQRLRIGKDSQINTRRRVRETSPSFFRENPAQTHRLVPWLNRELNALLEGHGTQVAFVLELIMGLITRYQISSDEFYEHLFPFIGRRTRQFMEEFLAFARSPHQMAAYDRHVTYETQERAPNHDSESDSELTRSGGNRNQEEDDDSDVIVVSPSSTSVQTGALSCPGAPQQPNPTLDPWERSILTAANPSYNLGFLPIVRSRGMENLSSLDMCPMRSTEPSTSVSGWESPCMYGILSCGEQTRFESLTSDEYLDRYVRGNRQDQTPAPSTSAPPVISNTQTDPISCIESETESNASDIMIVDYEKPWTERSPIRLSSGEESDFDVMITGTSYPNDPVKTESKKKKQKKSHGDKTETLAKRKRNTEDSSRDRHHKKRHKKSRSRSPSRHSSTRSLLNTHQSKSRSPSPIRMRLHNYSDYLHKKYNYHHPSGSLSKRSNYRSSVHGSLSGSTTDTDSDAESHVSIRSRKEKSRTGHSSIEIVEYRKKSSKYKKGKKHKSKSSERDRYSDIHTLEKTKRHKKDKSDKKHKKSKRKSKHKKGKHSKKEQLDGTQKTSVDDAAQDDDNSALNSEEDVDSLNLVNDLLSVDNTTKSKIRRDVSEGTSDSELDSNTDDDLLDIDKIINEHLSDDSVIDQNPDGIVKDTQPLSRNDLPRNFSASGFNPSHLELVELSGTTDFDKDLESITKNLPITTSCEHQDDFARLSTKSFKKHPHGHKKSSKNKPKAVPVSMTCPSVPSENELLKSCAKKDSNIQSSDITSCSDIDSFLRYPCNAEKDKVGFETAAVFSVSMSSTPAKNAHDETTVKDTLGFSVHTELQSKVYESPTSSGYRNLDFVDTEAQSGTSNTDVLGVQIGDQEEKNIDVERLSDSESEEFNGRTKTDNNKNVLIEKQIDVLGSSSDDSDTEVAVIAGPTFDDSDCTIAFREDDNESIDVTGGSDIDVSDHLVIDSESDAAEIDVLNSADEGEKDHILSVHSDDEENKVSDKAILTYCCEKLETGQDSHKEEMNSDFGSNVKDLEQTDKGVVGLSTKPGNECSSKGNFENLEENTKKIDSKTEQNDLCETDSGLQDPSKCDISNFSSSQDVTENSSICTQEASVISDIPLEKPAGSASINIGLVSDTNSETTKDMPSPQTSVSIAVPLHSENECEDATPQVSIDWTSNQNFESSTVNNASSSLVSFSSTRTSSSPQYMYDSRTTELILSPDLTFETLSESSPGGLSPSSNLSDAPDNFVPED